jgi:hypothetical protein
MTMTALDYEGIQYLMPWQNIGQLTDDDLRAILYCLPTLKPVHNAVPAPRPPPAGTARE